MVRDHGRPAAVRRVPGVPAREGAGLAPPAQRGATPADARPTWRANQPALFLAGLHQVEKQYPSSSEATEAKILRAKYYVTDEVKYDLAIADLEAAIAAGAAGTEGENIWTLGWTYFRAGRFDDAIKTFAR